MIAEVIINRTAKKLNRTFDYNIPKDLEELIVVGSKVLVPFGKSEKLTQAFVVGLKEETTIIQNIKDIKSLEENLTNNQINLARWMAKRYFCSVSDCIKLMLTPGTNSKNNKVKDKTINTIVLKKDIEEIELDITTNKIKSPKQKKVINFVKNNEGATAQEIEMFTNCSRAIITTLIKNGYLRIVEKKIERDPLFTKDIEKIKKEESTKNLKLNEEQQIAYEKISKTIEQNKYKSFLLYGITGSRKNRNIFTINTKSN